MSNCEIKHDKGTSSSIYTGTSLMPNVVAKYVPEEFKVMERGEDFEVGRHPSELESGALLEETIKQQIRQSGSYQLSPFCLVLDSDVNMVELENGDVIPWRELQGLIGGVKIKDTAFSSVVPTEWHPAGKKEACRYTLQDGTKFDVTLEHEFETVMNGTVLKLPIHQIFDLKLPLLKANKVRPTRPLGQAKINFPIGQGALMEGEDYCPILGMEESYAISSYGRIWDYRQKKWVETSINDLSLCLSGNHNSLCEEKASLVARHFLNNPSFDTAILYKDGDHTNFELSNLEWCTLSMQSTIVKKILYQNNDREGMGIHKAQSGNYTAFIHHGGVKILVGTNFATIKEAKMARDTHIKAFDWHKSPYNLTLSTFSNPAPRKHNLLPLDHYTQVYIQSCESLGMVECADVTVDNYDHIYLLNGYRTSNSFNWNQMSQIYTVIQHFKRNSNSVNLSSCRVDAIADDPGLAQIIKYFGSTSLPTAVEGISNRIRNFLQKSITKEELYKGMAYIIETDFTKIKIYMIYTGLENEDDMKEWEEFLKYVTELKRKFNRPKLPITVSFTPLFSTLGTPTQYHGSRVSKSLKQAVPPIIAIKKIANRFETSVRLSSSLDASDYGQLADFLDRRGQPLMEYGSLCSFNLFPKFQLILYRQDLLRELTKKEYSEITSSIRWEMDGKYWTCDGVRKLTSIKLWEMMNEFSLYPDVQVPEFIALLNKWSKSREIDPKLLSWIMPSMRRVFGNEHGRILAIPADSDNVLFTYPNGKRVFAEADAFRIDPLSAHHMKEITPVMTNGVTFEDIIADKGAMNIFPSQHISAGATRSVLKNWAQYVQNLTHVYETYCVSTDSELNIQINPEGNLTNPLILDHNKHPEIKDQITSGDFDPMKFAKDTGQHYFFNTQGLEEAMQIIAQQDQE